LSKVNQWLCKTCGFEFIPSGDYQCPQCGGSNTIPKNLPKPRETIQTEYSKFGGEEYKPINVEEIDQVKSGSKVVFNYVISEKPVIRNTPSLKPLEFKLRFFRFTIWTELVIQGITAKYYGPLLVKKGEAVRVWGTKHHSEFIIDGAETEERIFISY
jgi:rubredoxin